MDVFVSKDFSGKQKFWKSQSRIPNKNTEGLQFFVSSRSPRVLGSKEFQMATGGSAVCCAEELRWTTSLTYSSVVG
jgi:hypothetical protein